MIYFFQDGDPVSAVNNFYCDIILLMHTAPHVVLFYTCSKSAERSSCGQLIFELFSRLEEILVLFHYKPLPSEMSARDLHRSGQPGRASLIYQPLSQTLGPLL